MNTSDDGSVAAVCSYCGRANPERLPACTGCGTPLTSAPAQTNSEPMAKSKVAAIVLALIFGPLGLFYATVSGALIMILVAVPLYFATRGGLLFTIGGRVVCAVWAFVALSEENEASKPRRAAARLLDEAARLESIDRIKAIAAYEEIVRLFPDTPASREAARNVQTLTQRA